MAAVFWILTDIYRGFVKSDSVIVDISKSINILSWQTYTNHDIKLNLIWDNAPETLNSCLQ